MKPLDKLTELLCENERVNKDIKELRKGCEIGVYIFETDSYFYGTMTGQNKFNIDSDVYELKDYPLHKKLQEREYENMEGYDKGYIDIIGNPLLERHLRMYCEDKNIYIKIDVDGMICEWQNLEPVNIITTLDNTKDLYEQSDSVIERILDFLIESKQGK